MKSNFTFIEIERLAIHKDFKQHYFRASLKFHAMNKFLTIFFLFSISATFAQELAKVNRVEGKYIFYLNEPVSDYDIVFTFKTDLQTTCQTISGLVSSIMRAANYEAGAQGRPYDAIIIGNTERDLAIKFKDTSKDNSLAKPIIFSNKQFFVFSEPGFQYTLVDRVKVFRANQLTNECRSVSKMLEEIMKDVEKLEKKGKKVKGIIVGNDQYHNVIQ
jgi:hypothetical protein